MSPVEWYYAHGDKQQGPLSPGEIKALADSGRLHADDLVWREGMDEWIPARKVKGLFASEDSATAKSSQAEPPQAEPPQVEGPPTKGPPTKGPPTKGPPAEGPVRTDAPPPAFEKSPAAFERAREGPSRHLFDFVLEFARGQFSAQFVQSTAKLFTAIGHYGLYAAMLAILGLFAWWGVKCDRLDPVLFGLGGVVVLFVLQYTASRFCTALARLNQGSPAQITSTAFLDCFALLSIATGAAALIWFGVLAIRTEAYPLVLVGVNLFILCEFAAFVALNPETLKITVSPDVRAGEEAIGIFAFLLKLGLLVAPVAFGVGVACGTLALLWSFWPMLQMAGEDAKAAFDAGIEPPAYMVGKTSANLVFFFAALPLLAYLCFLLYYLAIDVIRAVLSLPGKLDRLAESENAEKEEG